MHPPMRNIKKQREFQRKWKAKRRADFFRGKKCVVCGSTERLELDHINRENKKDHKIWTWREERRNEEIRKCQVLCKKCHIQKTNREKGEHLKHGTVGMYKSRQYRCRCLPCKRANAQYEKQRRKRA